jgi:hypothetical protein
MYSVFDISNSTTQRNELFRVVPVRVERVEQGSRIYGRDNKYCVES